MVETLKVMGAVAGIGGLALGVTLILLRGYLQKVLEAQFGRSQAYKLFRLFLVLVWLIGVIGIIAYA